MTETRPVRGEPDRTYRLFRWTRWGPAQVRVWDRPSGYLEVTVGDQTVGLDRTDRGSHAEREGAPARTLFDVGVPVWWNGRRVGALRTGEPRRTGLLRRAVVDVVGEPPFVEPGMRFTLRALPPLATLRCDAGVLVASRRWAELLNAAAQEWTPYDDDVLPPKVRRSARAEHIALWLALRAGPV